MGVIELSALDLVLAAVIVVAVAAFGTVMRLRISRSLLVNSARMALQLLLVGLVLRVIFRTVGPVWVGVMSIVMLAIAGREVMARQKRRMRGLWGFWIGTASMFLSSFLLTAYALMAIIGPDPWYLPQYAIPLLGMLLGNTMSGVSLSLDRLTTAAWDQRVIIEQRLALGQPRDEAFGDVRRESMRAGMMPLINSMAAAGLVSLPGMMTGQILAGSPPFEAVKYQILIFLLIAAGVGFGTLGAIRIASMRLFDGRHRLRLDRLSGKEGF